MIRVHKEFRSAKGLAYKLLKNTTDEIMNQTAGLMTSEESYAEKRGTFTQMAKDQLDHGKYLTAQKTITAVEDGMDFCLDDDNTVKNTEQCKSVKKTTKSIPIVAYGKNGQPEHAEDDLKGYGITISGFNVIDWSYEPKTLEQIATKRQATMAIITAKANADKAKQDAITAEQEGLANVMSAKYQEEVTKEKAIVVAQREKEVAVIAAQQQVQVAEQQKLEALQHKLAAAEEKQRQILLGEGEAKRKQLVMAADGQLQVRLDALVKMNGQNAEALASYKGNIVPQILFGADGAVKGGGAGNGVADLLKMMTVNNARALGLNLDTTGKAVSTAVPSK